MTLTCIDCKNCIIKSLDGHNGLSCAIKNIPVNGFDPAGDCEFVRAQHKRTFTDYNFKANIELDSNELEDTDD